MINKSKRYAHFHIARWRSNGIGMPLKYHKICFQNPFLFQMLPNIRWNCPKKNFSLFIQNEINSRNGQNLCSDPNKYQQQHSKSTLNSFYNRQPFLFRSFLVFVRIKSIRELHNEVFSSPKFPHVQKTSKYQTGYCLNQNGSSAKANQRYCY